MNNEEIIKEIESIITLHYQNPESEYAITLTKISSLLEKRYNIKHAVRETGGKE